MPTMEADAGQTEPRMRNLDQLLHRGTADSPGSHNSSGGSYIDSSFSLLRCGQASYSDKFPAGKEAGYNYPKGGGMPSFLHKPDVPHTGKVLPGEATFF